MQKSSPRLRIKGARVVSRFSEISRLCANKKVLHLGCADMPYTSERGEALLHLQLSKVTAPDKLWGLDLSEEGLELLSQMGFSNLILGNVEEMSGELLDQDFDVIVAGEIIEHLSNPGLFLRSVASVMTANTELILTTPNATSIKGFVHAITRHEKVHPEHNFYFSYRTLKHLMEEFDLKCKEIQYYQDIEGRGLSRWLDKAMYLITKVSPVVADGLLIRATR